MLRRLCQKLAKLVIERIAHGATTRGDTEFTVYRGEVRVDRARDDVQLVGNLRISKPGSNQAQHFQLTYGQVSMQWSWLWKRIAFWVWHSTHGRRTQLG